MALLFLSEVGPSRTLLWAWRGVENRHFISTLWDKQAQMRIWTSSPGHSLFELERGSSSRKHLVLTAVNTTVAGCALSDAHPWSWDLSSLSAWRLSFSPVLDLLLPVSCVFFLSFFFWKYHCPYLLEEGRLWGKFLEIVQEWKYLYYILALIGISIPVLSPLLFYCFHCWSREV